ncbi:hypothetical protein K438DRAFT_253355 [Mycena galopus ATCC 62051]|nr:hypothetical protein K438DRAFT_253355 [Mycena galopus ATCC 62051]
MCAVTRYRSYRHHHPASSPFAPLFVTSAGAPLTRSYALHALDDCLTKAGYDSSYTPEQIKLLGRWKSDAWKLYVDQPLTILRDLSARLHHPPARPPARPASAPPSASLTIHIPAPRPAPSTLCTVVAAHQPRSSQQTPSSQPPRSAPAPRAPTTPTTSTTAVTPSPHASFTSPGTLPTCGRPSQAVPTHGVDSFWSAFGGLAPCSPTIGWSPARVFVGCRGSPFQEHCGLRVEPFFPH